MQMRTCSTAACRCTRANMHAGTVAQINSPCASQNHTKRASGRACVSVARSARSASRMRSSSADFASACAVTHRYARKWKLECRRAFFPAATVMRFMSSRTDFETPA